MRGEEVRQTTCKKEIVRHTSVTFQLTVFFICMILFGYGFAALTCHAAGTARGNIMRAATR